MNNYEFIVVILFLFALLLKKQGHDFLPTHSFSPIVPIDRLLTLIIVFS